MAAIVLAVLVVVLATGGRAIADAADQADAALEACRFKDAKALIEGLGNTPRRRVLANRFREAVKRETRTQELFRQAESHLGKADHEAALQALTSARVNTACKSYVATIDRAIGKVRQRWSVALGKAATEAVQACDFKTASTILAQARQRQLPEPEGVRAALGEAYAREKTTFELWEKARALRRDGQAKAALGRLLAAGFHTRCAAYGRRIAAGAALIATDVEAARGEQDWGRETATWPGSWRGTVKLVQLHLGKTTITATDLRRRVADAAATYREAAEADVAARYPTYGAPPLHVLAAQFRLAAVASAADLVGTYLAAGEIGIPVALAAAPGAGGVRLVVPGMPPNRSDARPLLLPLRDLPDMRALDDDELYAVSTTEAGRTVIVRLSRADEGHQRLDVMLALDDGENGLATALGLAGLWMTVSADLDRGEVAWPDMARDLDKLALQVKQGGRAN